jgi:hypothetical protein
MVVPSPEGDVQLMDATRSFQPGQNMTCEE